MSRLDSLTGLRFVAAFAVFGYHVIALHPEKSYAGFVAHVFGPGAVGVSFFFILSGFVLTWSHQAGDTPVAFVRRRLARIYPLHFITWVFAGVILVWLAEAPHKLPALSSLVLIAPWIPSWHFYGAMNAPSWSLGCELFFYVTFPFVLPRFQALRPAQRRAMLVTLVLFAFAMAAICAPALDGTTRSWALHMFPLARWAEFLAGIIVAIEVGEQRLPRIPLGAAAAVALTAYLAISYVPYSYGVVALTFVPFMLLIAATAQADIARRSTFLSSRAMVRLGAWSFAFYLVHAEVITVLAHLFGPTQGRIGSAVFALSAFGATLVVTAFLHRFAERPLEARLRGSRRPNVASEPDAELGPGDELPGIAAS